MKKIRKNENALTIFALFRTFAWMETAFSFQPYNYNTYETITIVTIYVYLYGTIGCPKSTNKLFVIQWPSEREMQFQC
jgi:hypothetical protein